MALRQADLWRVYWLVLLQATSAHWGTASAIKWLETAALAFYLTNGSRLVPVGDISLEHGGDIAGHDSHEDGLDVDLRLIRTDNAQCSGGTTWQNTNYDQARTRAFILSIYAAAPGHIKLIFFNDPVLINEGLTSPFTGHDDHIHIRFCEAAHPNPNIPFRYDCLVNWPYRELSLPFIQK